MAGLGDHLLPPPASKQPEAAHPLRPTMDEDMQQDWTVDLHACRRCLHRAKRFAVINATLEKWSLATGYLSLTWATAVLLSGHVANMDLWDFWVVTAVLTVGAARTLVVSATSRLTKLWEAGCINLSEGHVLPLKGEGAPRGIFSGIKLVAMFTACSLSCFRILALVRGGPFISGHPYSSTTLPPSLYVYYTTVIVEALILLVALAHRSYCISYKKRFYLSCGRARGLKHTAEQSLLWRLFARHVLDACITGSIFDGMQCHYIAFLVKQAVFHWKRVTVAHGGHREALLPCRPQRQAAALLTALQLHGSTLEKATLRWMLQHDEGVRYWHKALTDDSPAAELAKSQSLFARFDSYQD